MRQILKLALLYRFPGDFDLRFYVRYDNHKCIGLSIRDGGCLLVFWSVS